MISMWYTLRKAVSESWINWAHLRIFVKFYSLLALFTALEKGSLVITVWLGANKFIFTETAWKEAKLVRHTVRTHMRFFGRKSESFWAVYFNSEQKGTINLNSFPLNYFSFYHCKLGCSTSFRLSDMTTIFCNFEKVFFFFFLLCNQKLATS